MATSTTGGQTWTVQGVNPGSSVIDLSQSQVNGARHYSQITDPSVAFDAQGQFYVLDSPHTADYTSGAVAISKFAFNGGNPTAMISDEVIYQWIQDPVYRPMLAVDSNVASQADGSTTQSDPYVNNVYVAWSTNNNIADTIPNPTSKNPNVIKVVASSDGGADFSTPVTVNSTGNTGGSGGNERDATPRAGDQPGTAGRPERPQPRDRRPWGAGLGDLGRHRHAAPTSVNQPKPLDAITMAPITNGGSGFDFISTATPMTINQAIAPPPAAPSTLRRTRLSH